MQINPQQQLQALASRAGKLADELETQTLPVAHDLEKSTREAAHDLERATVALERDEEALLQRAKQAMQDLVTKK